MGRIGWGEFLVIVIIAAIVIGPDKLPELGKALGKAVRSVKKYVSETAGEIADVDELREIKKDVESIQSDVASIGKNIERSVTEPVKEPENAAAEPAKEPENTPEAAKEPENTPEAAAAENAAAETADKTENEEIHV